MGVAVGVPVLSAAPATAAPATAASSHTITITGSGFLAKFNPNTTTIGHGDTLAVHNTDTTLHTFTSDAAAANGTPLFDVNVPAGGTVAIPVAARLAAGTYRYHCKIHTSMHGALVVTGTGGGIKPAPTRFRQRLTFPKVLRGAHPHIVVKQAYVRLLPTGPKTLMWTYNGTYPGPTIRRPAGHDTKLTFTNRLPAAAGAITVHLHGDHHSAANDGRPDSGLIAIGKSRTYDYKLKNAKRRSPAATDFYHDHRMGLTNRNVWNGLEGMFIVDNTAQAKRLGLPTGRYDLPLMFSNRSVDSANQLISSVSLHHAAPNDATVGNLDLVNGRYAPYAKVRAHRYRLRLVNGSNFTNYTFKLSNHRKFTQIGTGDALLPKAVRRSSIPLGPGQRADVVVNFRGELHKNVVLRSGGTAIMQFRVVRRAADKAKERTKLVKPASIKAPKKVSSTLTFRLRTGSSPAWTINGRTFDPRRVDIEVPLNSTRVWLLRNKSTMVHYVHVHEEEWHTLARDGKRPPPWERGLEDTWRLAPGESVKIAAKFTDYTGVFMFHCHMLDHEDDGLMGQFAVYRRGHKKLPVGYYLAGTKPATAYSGGMGVALAVAAITPTSDVAAISSGSALSGMSGMSGMTGAAGASVGKVAAARPAADGATADASTPAAWQRMAIIMSSLLGLGAAAWLVGAAARRRRRAAR